MSSIFRSQVCANDVMLVFVYRMREPMHNDVICARTMYTYFCIYLLVDLFTLWYHLYLVQQHILLYRNICYAHYTYKEIDFPIRWTWHTLILVWHVFCTNYSIFAYAECMVVYWSQECYLFIIALYNKPTSNYSILTYILYMLVHLLEKY